MIDRFTERGKRVLQLARDEAGRLNHEYIGTEHLLLGLAAERSGVASQVLQRLGVDLDKVREAVEALVQVGPSGTQLPDKIVLTPRAKRTLDSAQEVARELGHSYVGTEHLLLGLLRSGGEPGGTGGVAARALRDLGIEAERVYAETLALLGVSDQASELVEWPKGVVRKKRGDESEVPIPQREIPWPEWVREAVNASAIIEVEERVAAVRAEKEAAVERQDFEAAAKKRDEERALREALPRQASLRSLRTLLDRPDDPACEVLRELGLDMEAAKRRLDDILTGDQ